MEIVRRAAEPAVVHTTRISLRCVRVQVFMVEYNA